jgi:hypothetical protein
MSRPEGAPAQRRPRLVPRPTLVVSIRAVCSTWKTVTSISWKHVSSLRRSVVLQSWESKATVRLPFRVLRSKGRGAVHWTLSSRMSQE